MTRAEIAGDLTAYAQDLGLAEEDLDETIYDLEASDASVAVNDGGHLDLEHGDAEQRASAINNEGRHAQVRRLIDGLSAEQAKRHLEWLHARKTRATRRPARLAA